MIVVDTSIWIDHLHRTEPDLTLLLERDQVGVHPLVIEELALGSLAHRERVLALLRDLRPAPVISHGEALTLIEAHALFGRGLSAVDVHIIGSVLVEPGAQLWTRDKRMRRACREAGGVVAELGDPPAVTR